MRRLRRLDTGGVRIDCGLGRYFQSLATSETCDHEMMTALTEDPRQPVGLDALPRRAWLHQQVGDPVTDGSRRAAAVSVATVVLMAAVDGGYHVLLTPRSGAVATHRFFNHVAPSGILAPLDWGSCPPAEEFSVRRNLLREYVEELYSGDEFQVGEEPYHDVESEPEVVRLNAVLDSGDAGLYYTGVSVNLLTLRPELCTLLLVTDPGWLRREVGLARRSGRPWRLAWEYLERDKEHELPSGRRHSHLLPLDEQLRPRGNAGEALNTDALIPNAAAAIALALPVARRALTLPPRPPHADSRWGATPSASTATAR